MPRRAAHEEWLHWLAGALGVAADVALQRWHTRRLPALEHMDVDVAGRTCIVTGPTSGIGRQTAAALAKRNAVVVLACRDEGRGQKLLTALTAEAQAAGVTSPRLEVAKLDVSCQISVRAFARRWQDSKRPLHVLINNAGIYHFSKSWQASADGHELHMATNFLGPHLLTLLLLPCLRATAEAQPGNQPGRVVNLSSRMHRLGSLHEDDPNLQRRYSSTAAYSASKLAQVAATMELQRKLEAAGANVRCFLTDPGEVVTGIARTLPQPLCWMYNALLPYILLSPSQGARSSVHCAGSVEALQQHSASNGGCFFTAACRPASPSPDAADQGLAAWLWPWALQAVDAGKAEVDVAKAPARR